ncbi:MAG: hypothetical protein AAFN79_02865 [Pseudomonadota bacterium]
MIRRLLATTTVATLFASGAFAGDVFNLGLALEEAERPSEAVRSAAPSAASSPTSAISALTLSDGARDATTLDIDRWMDIAAISANLRPPERDPNTREVPFDRDKFKSDPEYSSEYDPDAQIEVYGGKRPVPRVTPPIEIGRELYGPGEIGEGIAVFGEKNRIWPQLILFGDSRTAVAYNKNDARETGQIATRLNLFFNFQLTGTDRILAFWRPLQDNGDFTRWEFAGPDRKQRVQVQAERAPNTLFYEGDLGAFIAGVTDEYQSYDLPISFGLMPLLFQNGVWMEDAILGGAFTIPAQNSPALGITNYDITFFGGISDLNTDAFVNDAGQKDEDQGMVLGVAGFFDVNEGYLELGYAHIFDKNKTDGGDQSYHNFTAGFSKRYFGLVSNATRFVANVGQNRGGGRAKTADGFLILSENAFITHMPLTLIPYANFWIGHNTPQSVARAGGAGGILRNVGLAFETDNLTGFPTLDPTGRDTLGGAIGLQYLFALDQQLVVEAATVIPWGDKAGPAIDNEYALSARYQIPITNQLILRADAIYGIKESRDDVFGARFEVRVKF